MKKLYLLHTKHNSDRAFSILIRFVSENICVNWTIADCLLFDQIESAHQPND